MRARAAAGQALAFLLAATEAAMYSTKPHATVTTPNIATASLAAYWPNATRSAPIIKRPMPMRANIDIRTFFDN